MIAALAVLVFVVAVFEAALRLDRYEARLDVDGARRSRPSPGEAGLREPTGGPYLPPGSVSAAARLLVRDRVARLFGWPSWTAWRRYRGKAS